VIPAPVYVSNLEQPEPFNEAVREFCRVLLAHSPKSVARRLRSASTRAAPALSRKGRRLVNSKTLEMDEGQASAGAQPALTALLHR
jgi:hypothetical protein